MNAQLVRALGRLELPPQIAARDLARVGELEETVAQRGFIENEHSDYASCVLYGYCGGVCRIPAPGNFLRRGEHQDFLLDPSQVWSTCHSPFSRNHPSNVVISEHVYV
jgi:hypothetical protein